MTLKNTAINAKSSRHQLFHYFVKLIFAVNLLFYTFSFLWLPSVKPYALYNLLCIVAIIYRISLSTAACYRTKFAFLLAVYFVLLSDTLYDIYLNFEKGLTMSVVILVSFVSAFLLDLINKKL